MPRKMVQKMLVTLQACMLLYLRFPKDRTVHAAGRNLRFVVFSKSAPMLLSRELHHKPVFLFLTQLVPEVLYS